MGGLQSRVRPEDANKTTSSAKMISKTRPNRVGPLSATFGRPTASLQDLLIELAFVLLSQGITPTVFTEFSQAAFVHAAAKWSRLRNGRVNYSRIAAQTGFTRAAVRRLLANQADLGTFSHKQTAVERVINGWSSDPAFLIAGKPKPLAVKGFRESFQSLARRYAGDIPPQAVLAELKRVKAVRTYRQQVQLRPAFKFPRGPTGRFLSTAIPVLLDLLRIVAAMQEQRSDADPVQRLVLPVRSEIDLAFVRERCVTAVRSMLEGLSLSLDSQSNMHLEAKNDRAFAITVLLGETQPKTRRSLAIRHHGVNVHGKSTKATPR
jgi:hypothetical protein